MASLTLKNLPEELLRSLREAAEKDRRSLTQEIIYLLDTALRSRGDRPASQRPHVDSQIAAWRELAGKWQSDIDRRAEVEQIMEQRSPGREVDL
jgi:plasmid stability protein